MRPVLQLFHLSCDFSVGHRLTIGNLQQNPPYLLPKRRSDRMQLRRKVRFFSRKIFVQPFPCLCKYRRFLRNLLCRKCICKIALPEKPQTGKPDFVRRQQNIPQPGRIYARISFLINICHNHTLKCLENISCKYSCYLFVIFSASSRIALHRSDRFSFVTRYATSASFAFTTMN